MANLLGVHEDEIVTSGFKLISEKNEWSQQLLLKDEKMQTNGSRLTVCLTA